jgi:hypothetical protein
MKLTIPVLLLSTLTCCATGTEYYVSPWGNDENLGNSPSAPWRTIARANTSAAAGDTIYIRGGTYRESIAPKASGTEAKRVTFKAYAKEKVVLTGVRRGIVVEDQAYVTVDGVACDKTDEYIYLSNSHHVWIKNCTFDHSPVRRSWPNGVRFRENAHHNWIANCRISRVGYSTADDDKGGVMHLGAGSDFNLIENCTISYGGHHLIEVVSSYNIIRNNYFHNEEWMSAPHRKETDGKAGNRHVIIDGSGTRNVLERNLFAFSGLPPDQDGSSGVSVRTSHNIIRRNVFCDNDLAGLNLSAAGYTKQDVRFNRVYHNVFFHNAYAAKTGFVPFLSGVSLTKYGRRTITDTTIMNNVFWRNSGKRAISFYHVDPANQFVSHNLLEGEGSHSSRRILKEVHDPLFLRDETPTEPIRPELTNFQLTAKSPCIDKGGFLTRTTTGGRGSSIPVVDAGCFIDGYGIVSGDLIQLEGNAQRFRIVKVDYDQHVITVDGDVTWIKNQRVSQPFRGARPDIGAYEFAQASDDSALDESPTADFTPGAPVEKLILGFERAELAATSDIAYEEKPEYP